MNAYIKIRPSPSAALIQNVINYLKEKVTYVSMKRQNVKIKAEMMSNQFLLYS